LAQHHPAGRLAPSLHGAFMPCLLTWRRLTTSVAARQSVPAPV